MALEGKEKAIWDEIVRWESDPYSGNRNQNTTDAAFDMRMRQFVDDGSHNAIYPDLELLKQVQHEYMLDPDQLTDALEIAEQEQGQNNGEA